MHFLDREQRMILVRAALVGTILGMPMISPKDSNLTVPVGQGVEKTDKQAVDLGLKIDEAGFLKAANEGPKFGSISKTNMDCLKPLGDFCVLDGSRNFDIVLNKPMLDFIFKESGLLNPSIPTRLVFVEDWLDVREESHVGGSTNITTDGSRQDILISLKAAALQAFKNLESNNQPLDQYSFNGYVSFFVSSFFSHEAGHAGAETKKLFKPGVTEDVFEKSHPQIFAFDAAYTRLFLQAQDKGLKDKPLIFGVTLKGTDIQAFRQQIFTEARTLNLIK